MIKEINGKVLPCVGRAINVQWVQFVDSGRNANGSVIAQPIGGRQIKFNSVEFPRLTDAEWSDVLNEIEKFEGELLYYDTRTRTFQLLRVYWGDASATPYKTDPNTGEVLIWVNCKCNIIDMGYGNV